jgi:hypothetical protein
VAAAEEMGTAAVEIGGGGGGGDFQRSSSFERHKQKSREDLLSKPAGEREKAPWKLQTEASV